MVIPEIEPFGTVQLFLQICREHQENPLRESVTPQLRKLKGRVVHGYEPKKGHDTCPRIRTGKKAFVALLIV